jgi:hypothetical protein
VPLANTPVRVVLWPKLMVGEAATKLAMVGAASTVTVAVAVTAEPVDGVTGGGGRGTNTHSCAAAGGNIAGSDDAGAVREYAGQIRAGSHRDCGRTRCETCDGWRRRRSARSSATG